MFKKVLLGLAIGTALFGGASGAMLASNIAGTTQAVEAGQTDGGALPDGRTQNAVTRTDGDV